jgi:hypothetical protein
MGLEQLQLFLTTYVRDASFRERYRHGFAEALELELKLEPEDIQLIRTIDLDDLDRSGTNFREERSDKRRTEFEQFVEHLAVYGPIEDFYAAYDRANPKGLLTRPLEMDRFLAFATEFILGNGLPEYLLDILRFCYHYVQLSDTPLEQSERELKQLPETGLLAYHRISLLKPYRVLNFRYDALSIASAAPTPDFAYLPPQPTQLLMQKSRRLFKRTQIFYTTQLPFLDELLAGSKSILELVSSLPAAQMSWAVEQLRNMHAAEIIAVEIPSHFAV